MLGDIVLECVHPVKCLDYTVVWFTALLVESSLEDLAWQRSVYPADAEAAVLPASMVITRFWTEEAAWRHTSQHATTGKGRAEVQCSRSRVNSLCRRGSSRVPAEAGDDARPVLYLGLPYPTVVALSPYATDSSRLTPSAGGGATLGGL
jgi:hypothetical protein